MNFHAYTCASKRSLRIDVEVDYAEHRHQDGLRFVGKWVKPPEARALALQLLQCAAEVEAKLAEPKPKPTPTPTPTPRKLVQYPDSPWGSVVRYVIANEHGAELSSCPTLEASDASARLLA